MKFSAVLENEHVIIKVSKWLETAKIGAKGSVCKEDSYKDLNRMVSSDH